MSKDDIAQMDDDFIMSFNDEAIAPFDSTGSRDVYGPTPSAESVDSIRQRAEQCNAEGHDEAAWTCLVHAPLMLLALENPTWKRKVGFVPW
jgi:hypothetical protein